MDPTAPTRVTASSAEGIFTITLTDASRRNALGSELFEQLEQAVARAHASAANGETIVVRLRGAGSAFCSGFDLEECAKSAAILAQFVRRLGALTAALRAIPAVVVAQVHGPALAGGCAIVAASDIVCASELATFGYPVHRIGVSPAVSLPTLMATAGCGGARLLALSGEVIDGRRAQALGLVHLLARDEAALEELVSALADEIARKPPEALRATKAWLNEIDGTQATGALGAHADAVTEATASLCLQSESRLLLAEFWRRRKGTT
ncbi:MAG: enoyl-CoA hydratase/isomerase family protein [Phycisphaerales bacterium]|nr:enoyl-CoA hydratase/isomerase family protein [Phycisphaerales bacterium]